MEPLLIEKASDTPGINFNCNTHIFEIAGKSMPDDPWKFYSPIFEYLKKYADQVAEGTNIKFLIKFDYFNTASSKLLLDMLDIFKEMSESGNNVAIEWYYKDGDDDMKEAGEEYSEMCELPFDMKTT